MRRIKHDIIGWGYSSGQTWVGSRIGRELINDVLKSNEVITT
jgi:N-acetylglucosamine kinase-like BadF-type ATPase